MKKQASMIRTLTSRSFKANRNQNLVAILAIVLTTMMFTSLFALSQSMAQNLREMNFQWAGNNSHLTFSSLTDEEMERIAAHESVRDWGRSIVIGIAENEALTGRQVQIRYGDEAYAASTFSLPTAGNLPVRADEIALDTITLDKLGLPYELGQEISLIWRRDLNSADYMAGTFTLSGYWDGNSAAMASMAWVSEAFVEQECAGVEQAAERILADTGLTDVSYSPNIAYGAMTNQSIVREVIAMLICMAMGYVLGAGLVPLSATTGGKALTASSLYVFAGSALFAYFTVLLSCMKPAKLAGKVLPMEALRYTDAGTSSKWKLKKSTGGTSIPRMALANLGRNKKRTVIVICSLTLGLVLLTAVYAQNARQAPLFTAYKNGQPWNNNHLRPYPLLDSVWKKR